MSSSWTGEVAQWVEVPAAESGDLSSSHSHGRRSEFCRLLFNYPVCACIHVRRHIHTNIVNLRKNCSLGIAWIYNI